MTPSWKNDSSVFENGKLRPGVYKIQNVVGKTYVDIREHSRELCGRPATVLGGKGLWEILPSGTGYTIRRLEPGKPEQFCIVLGGLAHGSLVSISTFPVAWRIEAVNEKDYSGHDYARFFWGTTNMTWDLAGWGSDMDDTPVQLKNNHDYEPCRIWKLIPVKSDVRSHWPMQEQVTSRLPPYDGNGHYTCSHHTTETSDDGFGTTVTEIAVTTTTTTVTTRKKYRVEGDQ